ncbi:MAG: sialate O-acetylesterase [Herbinix sp.]|jgi:sialate O-acetylesterase|nr:sialate O-acetylesterase [Herbinix sp.]
MEEKGLVLSPILCDGMILQREVCNRIYGTEKKADTVTVCFMDKEYSARVEDNFDFSVELPPVEAGGPYRITVKGSSEITISDILFGDVYLLSGQSNMELPIRRVLDVSANEIKNTSEPMIRQYLLPATFKFSEPEKYMYASSWKKAMGEDLMNFSAAGYFFAKEIKESYQVPIGLIMSAVGGCRVESWMNPVTLRKFGDYEDIVKDFKDPEYFKKYLQEQQNKANEWISHIEEEEQKFLDSDNYKEWDTCRIPSLVSDYDKGTFNGSVYLCKEVILDSEPVEEDAYIYMGTIIDSDRIWINGILVGRTEYRYPPRNYPIQKGVLKKGSNLITVRIVINNNNGGTIKGRPYHLYSDGLKTTLEGDWYYRVGKKTERTMPAVLFPPNLPISFYNTVVVPLSKLPIKGVLWYQGESNTADPKDYAEKFSAMVSDWRELSGWQVPFIYVQLVNYREPLNTTEDTGWAELREQQRQNLSLEDVAMVVALDIGESNDLHPQNKKAVGVRLAKAARHLIYKDTLVHSGPLPKQAKLVEKSIEVCFEYLEDTDDECKLNNFELANTDGTYHTALAIRKGNRVFISCDKVETPTSVRYAWCDNPSNVNFYNDAGLPATGFRLDI